MLNFAEYYFFLTQLTAPMRMALSDLSNEIQIPFLATFVLGLLGAFSPCQLSTNLAAFAFISRDAADDRRVARSATAYILGKVAIYNIVWSVAQ